MQLWEADPSLYGLRRSARVQRDFTTTVDYVGWQPRGVGRSSVGWDECGVGVCGCDVRVRGGVWEGVGVM